jgi:hypothetical protein
LDLINHAACCHLIVLPAPQGSWQGGWQGGTSWFAAPSTLSNPSTAQAIQRFITATVKAARCMVSTQSCFDRVATEFNSAYGTLSPESKKLAWEVTRQSYPPNGGLTLKDLQAWFDGEYLPHINPDAKGHITLSQVPDPTFVKATVKELGVDNVTPSDPVQTTF